MDHTLEITLSYQRPSKRGVVQHSQQKETQCGGLPKGRCSVRIIEWTG